MGFSEREYSNHSVLQAKGWMDHECFVQTLEHLHKVSFSSMENKILLIMDNAECHMSIMRLSISIQHGIVIVHAATPYYSQTPAIRCKCLWPLQVCPAIHSGRFQKSQTLTCPSRNICCQRWRARPGTRFVMSPTSPKGFRATGIFPVNRNIFPDDAFAGAEVTEQAPPDDDDDCHKLLPHP
ncbi:hypothetical protein GWK47_040957 [Chionoecetes opilio]|uniref:DDE-1 domain-containing protein n=1 Tax=Chionoecetes opilio TaxID=41210 RepID=A0A8J4YBM8_CHIOP|nr:hypothetical protein GWK47_040957 [Chionoecetes opilio]